MFNDQLVTSFIVENVVGAGARMGDLNPYDVALLDVETNLTVDAATFNPDKTYKFVWKSPSTGFRTPYGGDERNANLPIQSLPLGRIDNIHAFENANRDPKPFIGYLGWDSVSACKSINLDCGKVYGLLIKARGKNVRDTFGRNFEEYIAFETDCCDDCGTAESATKLIDKIYEAIEKRSFYNSGAFWKAEKVVQCCPDEGPFDRTRFDEWTLTIQDEGDSHALARVRRAYSDQDIERVSYKGITSVYSTVTQSTLVTPDDPLTPTVDERTWTVNAPANFTSQDSVRVNCATCPSGYSTVNGGDVWMLTFEPTDPNDLTTSITTATGGKAPASFTVLSVTGNVYTIEVIYATATAVVSTDFVATVQATSLGARPDYCQGTPTNIAWVQGEELWKIERTLTMIVKNEDCTGGTRLAEMVEYYSNTPNLVSGSIAASVVGDCTTSYSITQYSATALADGCDTKGTDGAKFEEIPAFEGHLWVADPCEGWTFDGDGCPVAPVDATVENCQVGIKFTGLFYDQDSNQMYFNPSNQVNVEPITLEISLIDQELEGSCELTEVPWTVVQYPQIAQGLGEFVWRDMIHSRAYDNHMYTDPDAPEGGLWNMRLGYDYGVKHDSLYHHFDVYHYSHPTRGAFRSDSAMREKVCFVVEADKVDVQEQLKTFLNATLLAHGTAGKFV